MHGPGRFVFINPNGHLVLSPPTETTRSIIARLITLTTTTPRDGPATHARQHHDAA